MLVAPGPFSQFHTCLECLWDTHWEASGTILQMRTGGPVEGEHWPLSGGGREGHWLMCWREKGGSRPRPHSVGGGPGPAGRQGSCRSPGCWS